MRSRTWLASVVALAVCSFSGIAAAHTDAAIADAEALLREIGEGVKAHEASAQDMSVVRYYLLEMKLGTGKLTPEAFCQQARAELQTMIAADGDEETKTGLAQHSDKVAAMSTSPELCRQGSAGIDSYLFGIGEPAKSEADVKAAERLLAEAKTKYRAGEIDRLAVARAEADAFEARHSSGNLSAEAYCTSGQATSLAKLTNWTEALAEVGQAGLLGRVAAKRRYYQFKALCQPPK